MAIAPRRPARVPSPSRSRSRPDRRASFARRHLGRHAGDLKGTLVLLAGALVALGVFDLAGPVGRVADAALSALVGWGRFLMPPTLVALGVMLVRGSPSAEAGRVRLGLAASGVAVCSLAHLARSRPGLGDLDALREAGGVLGALVGGPAAGALGPGAAALVLVALAALGALVALRLSLKQTLAGGASLSWRATRFAGTAGLRWVRGLFHLSSEERSSRGSALVPPQSGEGLCPGSSFGDTLEVAGDLAWASGEAPGSALGAFEGVSTDDASGVSLALDPAIGAGTVGFAPTDTPEGVSGPSSKGRRTAERSGPGAFAGPWRLPSLDLLSRRPETPPERGLVERDGQTLEATLREFGVDARLAGMTVGPTVTRFELELGPGVKVSRVTGLGHDIAYAMASPDVRIIAPIPGRSAIGVEVPNRRRQVVALGDVLVSPEAAAATHPLEVALGRDIAGRGVVVNLASMPHVLIAGATGSGKSSCINSLLISLLTRSTPEQVRLILIDPKRVELGVYNGLPHLLTEVVTNPKRAANALDWAVREMELRYDLLAEVGARDIGGYNAIFDRGDLVPEPGSESSYARLPYILVVVDELNDLMMVAARDVEASICRLAQMARAVGIHLVIATQRPSVDVITGVIKANVPARMAFSVSSLADSRVILDAAGAEKLVGKGDMLLLSASSSRPQRIQGAWIDEGDVSRVVAHWKRQASAVDHVPELVGGDTGELLRPGGEEGDGDDLLEEAMELVVRGGLGSTSMLQRRLRVGFARAGRLMDLLERRGVVGPSEGSKARAVLMSVEELEERRR